MYYSVCTNDTPWNTAAHQNEFILIQPDLSHYDFITVTPLVSFPPVRNS